MFTTKFLKKSFSNRIIGAFLLVLVFLYLLYLGIFRTGYNLATNEISKVLYTKTSFCIETLEDEIGRIQKLQNECLNDDLFYYTSGAFSIMTKREQTARLLELQERLKILHESSTYIEEAYVYFTKLNWKISSMEGVEQITSITPELIYMQEKSRYSVPFYYNNRMYLGVSYPYIMTSETSIPNFILVIRLSDFKIKETLGFLQEYQDSGVKLVDEKQIYMLSAGSDICFNEEVYTSDDLLQWVTETNAHRDYLFINISSELLDMNLYAYISADTVYDDLNIYKTYFIVSLTAIIILTLFYLYSMYTFINQPIYTLVDTIEQMEKGDLDVRISDVREDEFGRVYDAFNQMVESFQTQLQINYKQVLLTQQAELRHLQSQINPHFLYNNFFSIYRMAKDEDCESIVELAAYLSEYYRYITKDAKSNMKLEEEVQHARKYAMIQAMRFRHRLSVEFDEMPAEYRDIIVPRLILQPLLENAFEHGLRDVEE